MTRRLIVLIVLFSTESFAQTVEDTTRAAARRPYHSFGFNASFVSGIGISYRNHTAGPSLFQVTGSVFSSEGSVFYSVGLEMQIELSSNPGFRYYIPIALGLYVPESKTTTVVGLGMGLEVPVIGPGIYEGVTIGGELFYPAVYLSTKNSVGLGGSIYIFYNL